jgi:DNA polymerase I
MSLDNMGVMEEPGEFVEVTMDGKGVVLPEKHNKKLIIDADTIAFSACIVCEYEVEDFETGTSTWDINLDNALEHAQAKIQVILDHTGGIHENMELHFTGGKNSFRYDLLAKAFPEDDSMHYKAKRVYKKSPVGLHALKEKLMSLYKGFMHYDYEADDVVVMLKKLHGDNAILCAVDKDVTGNVPGVHWNYYESLKHNIPMCWMDVSPEQAMYNQHIQAIMGDKSDNVPGIKGIGPAKAAKFLEVGMDEAELWGGVLRAYLQHCSYGDPVEMAILNMRLVNMHQLQTNGEVILWNPPV